MRNPLESVLWSKKEDNIRFVTRLFRISLVSVNIIMSYIYNRNISKSFFFNESLMYSTIRSPTRNPPLQKVFDLETFERGSNSNVWFISPVGLLYLRALV